MIKLLTILLISAVGANGQDMLDPSNVVRYSDLKNISIYRKAGTDSIFLAWTGGGKTFLYRDSVELRVVGGSGLDPADTTAMLAPYLRSNVADVTFAAISHAHTIANITGLQTALDGKASSSHSHAISDVTNLQTTLDGKAALSHNHAASDVNSGTFADARIPQSSVTQHQSALTIAQSQVTNLVSDLAGKQASNSNLSNIAGLTLSNDNILQVKSSAITQRTPAQLKTDLALTSSDVGLGNANNTSDANKPVSTATQAALDLKANLASPTFTGTVTIPTSAAGDNSTKAASTAFVQAATDYGSYQTILEASGSHTAARVAGTYALGMGDPIAVSGTGTLYPLRTIYIAAADYPSVDGKATKLRLRIQFYTNDVAPTGNYTFGLYPVTRPGTSGGAGLATFTLGTVVGSSTVAFNTPAADGLLQGTSSDFSLPTDGHYVIGVVTTATVAASAHIHISASLQKRNN